MSTAKPVAIAGYRVPDLAGGQAFSCQQVIHRSRFVASACRVTSAEDARAFVERIRAEHPGASHNCWAFEAGPAGSTAQVGASDDGEPKGTAGRPMLTVLLHSGIGEVAVVVTRYFGGVLLGTGGLVKAYQGLARQVLEGLPVRTWVPSVRFRVECPWSEAGSLERAASRGGARLVARSAGALAQYTFEVPVATAQPFAAALRDASRGQCTVRPIRENL